MSIDEERRNLRFNNSFSLISSFDDEINISKSNLQIISTKKYLFVPLKSINKLEEILETLKNCNINLQDKVISIDIDNDAYITKEQCEQLVKTRKILREQGADLQIKDGEWWSIEEVLITNTKIDSVVEKIKNATIIENGETRYLNEYEKFLWAYSFVANRKYKENKLDLDSPRCLTSIFKTNDIVCVGFATMLKEICNRLGIECYTNSCNVVSKDNGKSFGHRNNIVIINNQPYLCDACADCLNPEKGREKSYVCCLVPFEDFKNMQKNMITGSDAPFSNINEDRKLIEQQIKELESMQELSRECAEKFKTDTYRKYIKSGLIEKYKKQQFSFFENFGASLKHGDKDEILYNLTEILKLINKKKKVKPIALEEFEKALFNVHIANGYNENESKAKVDEIIKRNLEYAKERYLSEATNCFATASRKEISL